MKTGSGRDEVYQSKWFGYDAFQFLMEKSKCRKTLNTVKSNLDEEAVKVRNIFITYFILLVIY
nr:unnamed protein product [Callosobruchus analis]CAI5842061.1 unnamed protein product [Callosobruchus analis]